MVGDDLVAAAFTAGDVTRYFERRVKAGQQVLPVLVADVRDVDPLFSRGVPAAREPLIPAEHGPGRGYHHAMKRALLFLPVILLATAAFGQDVQITVSSRAGDRLTDKPALRFAEGRAAGAAFRLDPGATRRWRASGPRSTRPG